MNEVYYGNHAYGIEAAAETYFSIPASQLNLEQSALLAGLPQAPSIYDPFHQPGDALARRNEVLHAMLVNGAITSSEYATAMHDRNLHLKAGQAVHADSRAVLLQLRRGSAAAGVRREHGSLGRAQGVHDDQSGAAACGARGDHARAHVADRSRVGDRLDRSADRRDPRDDRGDAGQRRATSSTSRRARAASPGSTFKTVALTTAVALGMNPFTTSYLSAPLHYQPDPLCNPTDPDCAWNVADVRARLRRRRVGAERDARSRTTRCTRGSRSTSVRRTSSTWRG